MVIPRLATLRRIPAVAALLLLLPVAAAAQIAPAAPNPKPPPSVTLAPVEVIGTSPLLGVGIDRDKVPSNVQTLPAPNIEMQGPAGLVNDLDQELGSVNLNANEDKRRSAWRCTRTASGSMSRSATMSAGISCPISPSSG